MAETLTTDDPFSLLHRRLWTVLKNPALPTTATLFKGELHLELPQTPASNYDLPIPANATPWWAVLQGPFAWRPFHFDAGAFDMTLSFGLVVVGNGVRVADVNAAKWHVARALVKAGPYLGLPDLVRWVEVRGGNDSLADKGHQQGHARTVSAVTVEVNATIPWAKVVAGQYAATVVPFGPMAG